MSTSPSNIVMRLPLPLLSTSTYLKIATTVWRSRGMVSHIEKYPNFKQDWSDIEKLAFNDVGTLCLPKDLLVRLKDIIVAVGQDVLRWFESHTFGEIMYRLQRQLLLEYLGKLQFTSHGAVDTAKMIAIMVQDERIDVIRRYRMACDYCIEDQICQLLSQLHPEPTCDVFCPFHEVATVAIWTNGLINNLNPLWERAVTGVEHQNEDEHDISDNESDPNVHTSPSAMAFQYALKNGLVEAMEFFWNKLPSCEQSANLQSICDYFKSLHTVDINIAVLSFAAPKLSRDCLRRILSLKDLSIIIGLTKTPYNLFPEIISPLFNLTEQDHFYQLLKRVVTFNVKQLGFKLFPILWNLAPIDHIRYIINDSELLAALLLRLITFNFNDGFRLILETLRTNMIGCGEGSAIFTESGLDICEMLCRLDNFIDAKLLEDFLGTCLANREQADCFMKAMEHHVTNQRRLIAYGISAEFWERHEKPILKNVLDKLF